MNTMPGFRSVRSACRIRAPLDRDLDLLFGERIALHANADLTTAKDRRQDRHPRAECDLQEPVPAWCAGNSDCQFAFDLDSAEVDKSVAPWAGVHDVQDQ